MPRWTCGIDGCDAGFDDVESAIVHQTNGHQRHECKVCGTIVPDGYFAIRHAFDAGSGRGAVNPLLNYSGPADSDGTRVDATMESSVTVPVRKAWLRGVGGRVEAETLRCEITETVTFIE